MRDKKRKALKEQYLKDNPLCAWCGQKANTVHHIIPVHVDKSLELITDNLISLCQTQSRRCHFVYGHRCNWSDYNDKIKSSKNANLIISTIIK